MLGFLTTILTIIPQNTTTNSNVLILKQKLSHQQFLLFLEYKYNFGDFQKNLTLIASVFLKLLTLKYVALECIGGFV